ncbi:phage portal protein [Hoeflea sp.]|uniref:phage portal protein n=1 Tax=Hoeflea sp. TaxID=1940281 RepID=UPI003747ADBA
MTSKPRVRVKAGRSIAMPVALPGSKPTGAPSSPRIRAGYMRDTQSGILSSRPSSLREHRDEVRRVWTRAAGLAMDLLQNSGRLKGAADQILVDAVGNELQLNPKPNLERFGYTREEAIAWIREIKEAWKVYAWNPLECDFRAKWTLPQQTDIGMRHWLAFGESVGVCQYMPKSQRLPGTRMGTKMLLLSPPQLVQDTSEVEGLFQGVVHDAYARPIAYRFEERRDGFRQKQDYPARDGEGRQVVMHAFDPFSSDDVRGLSPLAPTFRKFMMAENADDATAQLMFLQTIYSAILTSDRPSAEAFEAFEALAGTEGGEALKQDFVDYFKAQFERAAESEIRLGAGAGISQLAPGESLDFKNITAPGPRHSEVTSAFNRETARALGMSYGGYTLDHTAATYSSIQMENASVWPLARRRTDRIAAPHYLVPYASWMDERIETGMTEFKGGMEVYRANRESILWAICNGPSKPSADDLKKAKATSERIGNGTGDLEREISEDGGDAEEVFQGRLYWHKRHIEEGMKSPFERGLPSDAADKGKPAISEQGQDEDA